ncbi:hypothetical protein Pcinc_003789 [Petrolisthes cinctipes]|uniref:C-type lectin domain-containing protein n=1 Tax=Petrolisthes cinctipes TaxID=88211 RepID=A0AAE1GID1_PETCI|nr:hypothetical protein Pcinc_003789 [Petrolisthes cinctipes]
MTSSLKVAILILGFLCPCSADITSRGPPSDVNSLTREVNELEENLAVNQLAILHLLNRDPSDVGSASHEAVWMGASDIASEGQWFWLSGTQLPNNFPWDGIQPDNGGGNEDCLEIAYKRDGTNVFYNDHVCTYPRHFVCEL